MADSSRISPMPKHWSFAGLLLTYWCNARCASCYLCCGPERREDMSVEIALGLWRELAGASPHGCRIHLSGGEPFGDWDRLIEICRRAFEQGLSAPGGAGPLDKVETNAFWAVDEDVVRRRLAALDQAGMKKLGISADPYHQQFVPIERCRLLARVAADMLGPHRVQVRWRDWLEHGSDTAALDASARAEVFARYSLLRRDRFNGRAAAALANGFRAPGGGGAFKGVADLALSPCSEALLRSRHVHVDGSGLIMPGTCAGIVLGRADRGIATVWQQLRDDHAARPILGVLASQGPVGLLATAGAEGFEPLQGYLSKCHLCWHVRRHLVGRGLHKDELGPAWFYQAV
jgi:hypothetical protein